MKTTPSKSIRELLVSVQDHTLFGDPDTMIRSIAFDSREVDPGSLFVALRGGYTDGHRFLSDAIERGAAACLVESVDDELGSIGFDAIVRVPDTRQTLAEVGRNFYDDPSRDVCLVGITGTDGKTTTSFLAKHLLTASGIRTGLIGTVAIEIPGETPRPAGRQTTPESLETQRLLHAMRSARADAVILETSSHGLETHRVDGCVFDVGVVTNITHEHLDFHGTVEAYRRAKARLFDQVRLSVGDGGRGIAIVNLDDDGVRSILGSTDGLERIGFSILDAPGANLRATDIEPTPNGSRFHLCFDGDCVPVELPTPGPWNVSNALAAAGIALALEIDLGSIAAGLATQPAIPGRMEQLDLGQPFQVWVDYAHSAPALELVIETLRLTTLGSVRVLFGSAGERDIEKRAAMGVVAASLADYVVVTSEDPRFEDPAEIMDDIASGAIKSGATEGVDFHRLEDRRAAIELILQGAQPGDCVILAGKGHERSMIYGEQHRPWNEIEIAGDVLRSMGFGQES